MPACTVHARLILLLEYLNLIPVDYYIEWLFYSKMLDLQCENSLEHKLLVYNITLLAHIIG